MVWNIPPKTPDVDEPYSTSLDANGKKKPAISNGFFTLLDFLGLCPGDEVYQTNDINIYY
jgi:hypothetical protein